MVPAQVLEEGGLGLGDDANRWQPRTIYLLQAITIGHLVVNESHVAGGLDIAPGRIPHRAKSSSRRAAFPIREALLVLHHVLSSACIDECQASAVLSCHGSLSA